jgi:DNA replication protein DnaC
MTDERLFDGAPDEPPDPLTVLARRAGGSSARCPFGRCDGSGFVVEETSNTAVDCACRRGLIAAKRAATLEGRVPKLYRGVSFDRPPVLGMPETIVSEVRRYVRNLEARLAEGRGLWLTGDVGTGKTSLAMIVSKAALDTGHTVAIYSLPRLLNLIRDEIGAENSLLDLLDSLSSVDLLHIDDLGAQHTTPWRLEQLYSIVDARYQAKRAIVATTHLMPDELAEQMGRRMLAPASEAETRGGGRERTSATDDAGEVVGRRIVSRLVEMCGDPLPLYGEDKRRELPAVHG